jgi:hypothetical protein
MKYASAILEKDRNGDCYYVWHIFNSLVHQTTPLSVQETWLLIINQLTNVQNCCSLITTKQVITSIGIHFTVNMTGII